MKTYKQMAERVLKRRDEYFEQKQDRKASRGVISAAVAACAVVVVILFGTIIGGVMKSPVTAPGTDAPPAASSQGSTEITADETETLPERVVIKDVNKDTYENSSKTMYGCYISAFDDLNVSSISAADMVGKKHKDICEVSIEVRSGYKYSKDFQKWITLIVPDERIELISPESNYFYFSVDENNGDATQIINLSYRYKDGETNGTMDVYVFPQSRTEFFEETYKDKLLTKNNTDNEVVNYSNKKTVFFATVKGYDYWGYTWDHIYGSVARYYGDVDENGIPLYEYDPYMADYCNNPICKSRIQQIQNLIKEAERDIE